MARYGVSFVAHGHGRITRCAVGYAFTRMATYPTGEDGLLNGTRPFYHGINPNESGAPPPGSLATGTPGDFFELNQAGAPHASGPARFGLVFNLGTGGKAAWAFEYRNAAGTNTGVFVFCAQLVDGDPTNPGNDWQPVAGGGGLPAFDGDRPITRSGAYYGLNVGGADLAEFVNNFFFPAVPPLAALNANNPVRRFGASPAVTLAYAVQAQDNPITAMAIGNHALPVIQSGTDTYTTATTANVDTNFILTVTAGADTATAQASVVYRHERAVFLSDLDLFALSDSNLSVFVRAHAPEFATGRQQSGTFAPNAEFIYYYWPAAFGAGAFVQNGLPNTAFVTHGFTFTNAEGYQELGTLTRTQSLQDGTQQITVN